MPDLNPEHVKKVIRAINQGPFFVHMSIKVTEMGIGHSTVQLDIGGEHKNPFGGIHGGVYASAIDTAAYWSGYCEIPQESGLITIDLKVDFLGPLSGDQVVIKGRRIKSGKTICLTEATMFDGGGTIIAHGTSKLMVTRSKQSIGDVADYLGSGKLPRKFLGN